MPSQKILIVDDEHSIIESLTGILEDEGYAITAATMPKRPFQSFPSIFRI